MCIRDRAYSVFAQVNCEPTDQVVDAGLAQYREAECDFLVAIGGGSPIDTMKAIAMLAVCGGRAADYMGKVVEEKLPAMAAIPTTAGTGSEATQFTIITDTATEVKMPVSYTHLDVYKRQAQYSSWVGKG